MVARAETAATTQERILASAWRRFAERPYEQVRLADLLHAEIAGNPIRVAGHCYGCTAGQGSSCGGALREAAE